MGTIIQIKGNVKFPITLDPSVWIFDDRKIDLNTYFELNNEESPDPLMQYKKNISKQWDREITEGATPPTKTSEKKFLKEKLLTGTFGMSFKPFLTNAEPNDMATSLIIEMKDQEIEIPLSKAYDLILGFSNEGKPLKEDGPAYVYYGDGSNKQNPIKNVTAFRVV